MSQPIVVVLGSKYKIIDLSESGIQIQWKGALVPEVGDSLTGTVSLMSGGTVKVSGKVVRIIDESRVVVLFKSGIPYKNIMAEQRYLIQKFGSLS